ncbi:ABC transporter substrate-binding protein [Streptomyces sp. NPDC087440]|uniref:ABC transporter substrate-binding protein n=1 Tax=Streptomyces sp. NPDC087440 TaxID=3365790 RepID=UPI003823857C
MHISRRSALIAGGALAAPLALSGATAALAAHSPSTAPSAADRYKPLPIGLLVDVSGPTSVHGQRQRLGAEYMARQLNAAGGRRPVELVFADTGGNPKTALTAVRKLIAGGVRAIVGTSTPQTFEIAVAEAEKARIPIVTPLGGGLKPPASKYAFRTGGSAVHISSVILSGLRQRGLKKLAVLYPDVKIADELEAELRRQAKTAGVEIVAVGRVTEGAKDVKPSLRPLLKADPDALMLWVVPPYNGLAAKAARELGWEGPLYLSPSGAHPKFFTAAGEAAEGVRAVAPWSVIADSAPALLPNRELLREFAAGFQKEHGPLGSYVSYGADAVGILSEAFTLAGDEGRALHTLERMAYVGVTGVYRMRPDNHAGLLPGALTMAIGHKGGWVRDEKFATDPKKA